MSETDCDYKLRLMCTAFIDSAIMKIRNDGLNPLTKFSRLAVARHGGPPINLFVVPTIVIMQPTLHVVGSQLPFMHLVVKAL